jgi:LPXTG-site transpeptidase (sortase) family protein
MEDPTGPIYPVTEQFVELPPDIVRAPSRRRRNPVFMAVIVFVVLALVLFGAGILGHRMITGNWGLPGVREQLPLPAVSTGAAPSTAVSMPSASPAVPPPQAAPEGPIAQDVPTHIVVRRGQTELVNSPIDGAYTPSGGTVNPPGDNPYWLSVSSKVGDGMTIPAVIVGHTMNGNLNMPFTMLGGVQAGDLIDITVPQGVITFQADTPQDPEKGAMGFGKEPDTVKLVTCEPVGNQNVVISGHRVSSHNTA